MPSTTISLPRYRLGTKRDIKERRKNPFYRFGCGRQFLGKLKHAPPSWLVVRSRHEENPLPSLSDGFTLIGFAGRIQDLRHVRDRYRGRQVAAPGLAVGREHVDRYGLSRKRRPRREAYRGGRQGGQPEASRSPGNLALRWGPCGQYDGHRGQGDDQDLLRPRRRRGQRSEDH